MEDEEQPSAPKATIARTSQACQRCRSLKTRCLPGPQSGVCQRCTGSGKECVWADIPRRARKLRAPSRISQVEEKIDGLFAKLVSPQVPLPVQDSAEPSLPRTSGVQPPVAGGLSSWSETWKKQGTVAPGSWMPLPNSFEQSSRDEESPAHATRPAEETHEQPNYETEADRQYFEKIRSVHNFGNGGDLHSAPQSLFQPSRSQEAPIEHALVQHLRNTQEADALLNEYRSMSVSFPFVIVPAGITAHELHRERPMLFLAMITAASWQDHMRQMSLDVIFRRELAERTIITPKRTLGLVQSVLVYLSWYHYTFSHKTQQIFFLHHLVVGLALDIGLHRDYQPMAFPHRPRPKAPSPQDQRERERTFLGCYYLSSTIGAGLQKPNLLKHAPYMTEWAQKLKTVREYETDETISHLITLRQIDDQVQENLFSASTRDLPLSDARTLMHVRFLESQLDMWKKDSQNAGTERLLTLSSSFTEMSLHSVALRPAASEEQSTGTESVQINSLLSALEAGKRFLDAMLSFPVDEYYQISFSEWMRLPTVIMTVAKICMPNNASIASGWDYKTAQDRVRLDLCLEALCYRMQQLSTYDKVKQTHPDFWYAMRLINDLTRNWYMKKTKQPASSQPTPGVMVGCAFSERSGPSTRALATPSSEQGLPNFGMEMSGAGTHIGANNEDDPFAFLKDTDFDMEQFFDMGIWGDDVYTGMGFGNSGGTTPF
ncbi:hypothetical protein HBI24_136280 [Parastagonospora nodorum]|nr:hypothetical protein HBH96_065510 [Parastagonospora nodorum]KAH5163701.1 hypothetical protein HBH69_005880 [Parastagonospora nodorum]KAH5257242.1 hypothetical protein HBI72_122020 [Parastagonospora nodorum]KAH5275592.1 hypothetical protein HBI70_099100 [Parastagonospora nodorum]KAH5519246.1 hypothetical protein HBI29_069500 [Parastagonospora nodorum]